MKLPQNVAPLPPERVCRNSILALRQAQASSRAQPSGRTAERFILDRPYSVRGEPVEP